MLDAALVRPQSRPSFVFVRTPSWPAADPATRTAFESLAGALGDACREAELPADCEAAIATHTTIAMAGIAWHYGPYHDRGAEQLSDWMRGAIADGRRIAAVDYLAALDRRDRIHAAVEAALGEDDVFLTPAAPGEAPTGLNATGSPAFNTLWSLCGMPAVSLPLLSGPHGLPLGVQLVGRRGDDAGLLRAATWLAEAGIVG